MAETGNFDHVSIQKASGWNLITAAEFFAIPLSERITLTLAGKVQFVRDGQVIPITEAFKSPSASA